MHKACQHIVKHIHNIANIDKTHKLNGCSAVGQYQVPVATTVGHRFTC